MLHHDKEGVQCLPAVAALAETDRVRLPFEPPSQSAWIVDAKNHVTGHVSLSGPILKMPVGDELIDFEMHRFFGPMPLRRDGAVRERIPRGFWDAFEAWTRTGKLMLGNVCCVE